LLALTEELRALGFLLQPIFQLFELADEVGLDGAQALLKLAAIAFLDQHVQLRDRPLGLLQLAVVAAVAVVYEVDAGVQPRELRAQLLHVLHNCGYRALPFLLLKHASQVFLDLANFVDLEVDLFQSLRRFLPACRFHLLQPNPHVLDSVAQLLFDRLR